LELIFEKIKSYVEKNESYIKAAYSISELSYELGFSRQCLSQCFCVVNKYNLNDFINSYRVEYFILLLKKNHSSKFTLFFMAFSSDFNSKTGFNTIFQRKNMKNAFI